SSDLIKWQCRNWKSFSPQPILDGRVDLKHNLAVSTKRKPKLAVSADRSRLAIRDAQPAVRGGILCSEGGSAIWVPEANPNKMWHKGLYRCDTTPILN